MKQPTFSNSIGIFCGIAILLLAVMAMLLFQIEDRYQIGLLLMAGALCGRLTLPLASYRRLALPDSPL